MAQFCDRPGLGRKTRHLAHRVREMWPEVPRPIEGPVEIDETYIGSKEKCKHCGKKLRASRGRVGNQPVVGFNDRPLMMSLPFMCGVQSGACRSPDRRDGGALAWLYTGDNRAYARVRVHRSVNHRKDEYVRGEIRTNGVEGR